MEETKLSIHDIGLFIMISLFGITILWTVLGGLFLLFTLFDGPLNDVFFFKNFTIFYLMIIIIAGLTGIIIGIIDEIQKFRRKRNDKKL